MYFHPDPITAHEETKQPSNSLGLAAWNSIVFLNVVMIVLNPTVELGRAAEETVEE